MKYSPKLRRDERVAVHYIRGTVAVPLNLVALRSQIGISKEGRGGSRYNPYAFTEQGVAMLFSVLRSKRAVKVNIEIVRTFVQLRTMLAENAELRLRLDDLEQRYDRQFKVVFDAIREIMTEKPPAKKRQIGFGRTDETLRLSQGAKLP